MADSLSTNSSGSPGRPSRLVGREREQARLRRALDKMREGHGSLLLVSGEAGIGKTALVDWLSDQAREQGCLVLKGSCYDLTVTAPYGPWIELAAGYATAEPGAALPGFVSGPTRLAPIASQEELFSSMTGFFTGIATQRPLMLVLEDLHWADPGSVDVLRVLARQLAQHRLLLVALHRPDELRRQHPLHTALPLLVREARAERIELRPLTADADRALIQGRYALPATDLSRLTEYLQTRAEGNPLFAGELLRTLEEEQVLRSEGCAWHLGALTDIKVPTLLKQVIEGRLARLGEEANIRLAEAAVIGQGVPLDLWATVSGSTEETLLELAERGIQARLLDPTATGVRFAHALVREAIYENVLPVRRRIWNRRIAEALLARPNPDPDQVANHFLQADDSRTAEWLVKAGERAERAYVWSTAVDRFEAAFSRLTEQGAPASERAMMLFHIAHLQRLLDTRRALTMMEEARKLSAEAKEPALSSYCQFLAGDLQCIAGDVARGITTMKQAAAKFRALSASDQTRLRVLLEDDIRPFDDVIALWLAAVGALEEAISVSTRVIDGMSPDAPSGLPGGHWFSFCHFGLGIACAVAGQPRRAQRSFAEARDYYRAVRHPFMIGNTCYLELTLVQLPYFADDMDGRAQLVMEGDEAFRRAGEVAAVSPEFVGLGIQTVSGHWDAAQDAVDKAYASPLTAVYARPWRALLALYKGDFGRASSTISGELKQGPHTEPGNSIFMVALPLQRTAIELALAQHDLAAARDWLEAHDRWLAWSGAVLGRAEGTLLWARYHLVSGDPARARENVEQALEYASNPRQPLALIAIHRFLGKLDAADQHFAEADRHLLESLRLTEACAAPFERALTLVELAELRQAQHQVDEAARLLDEVQAICEPLGAAPTLGRVDTLRQQLDTRNRSRAQYPAGLSPREVDVLRLVAAGLTDAEIADQLYLSRRTVSTHLRSVYNKIGIGSRAAAARFAVEHQLV